MRHGERYRRIGLGLKFRNALRLIGVVRNPHVSIIVAIEPFRFGQSASVKWRSPQGLLTVVIVESTDAADARIRKPCVQETGTSDHMSRIRKKILRSSRTEWRLQPISQLAALASLLGLSQYQHLVSARVRN